MSVLPLDIWRHLLSFNDPELSCLISLLSKTLNSLAKGYSLSRPIVAYQMTNGYNFPVTTSDQQKAWDHYIRSTYWITSASNPPHIVFRTQRHNILTSQDGRYTRSTILNTHGAIKVSLTSKDRSHGFNIWGSYHWPLTYEYFDRKCTIGKTAVVTTDRYHMVLLPDRQDWSCQGCNSELVILLEQFRPLPRCNIRWYSEQRQLHITVDLGVEIVPAVAPTKSCTIL